MKKILAIAMAVLLLAFAGCTKQEEVTTGMPNPYEQFNTLEEASEKAGIPINVPDTLMNYQGTTEYYTVDSKMVQVEYGSNDRTLTVRKAEGTDDISGDYTDYPEVAVRQLGGFEVTEKGKDGKTYVETWTDGTYTYSIQSNNGFDRWDTYEVMAFLMEKDPFTPFLKDLKNGWTIPENMEFSGAVRDMYDRAEPLEGVGYAPIALLAEKKDEGKTYYCFLAEGIVIYPGTDPFYALMYLCDDGEHVTICGIEHVGGPEDTELLGGWSWPDSNLLTEDRSKLFNDAMRGQIGIAYEPVLYLANQVVNGTNHCYLARITGVSPSRITEYDLVVINEGSDGSLSVESFLPVEIELPETNAKG